VRKNRQGAQDTGIHWTSDSGRVKQDNAYATAFKAVQQIAADHFEGEIYRRGFDGYEPPVTYQGKVTRHYTDYP